MPIARVNEIELYWESFGDVDDPTLLLISGLGAHCTGFDDRLCGELAGLGLCVIRYDNRDVGLSTHFQPDASYTIGDMAADAAGLIAQLALPTPVHVLGASMGGMIAQQLAIDHPELVRSLTLIMTSSGEPDVGQPSGELLGALVALSGPADSRDEAIEAGVALARLIGSPDFDEDYHRQRQQSFYDRAYDPPGVGRQAMSLVSSPSREVGLRDVRVPAVVIHGSVDPLVDNSGGRRVAELIPGARYVEIEGMGHDLASRVWPEVLSQVASVTTQATSERS